MVAMVKLFLLSLVVFMATALENSLESDSNHELFPHSSPPPSSPPYAAQELDFVPPPAVVVSPPPPPPKDHRHAIARALCIAQCAISCLKKKSFLKEVCMGICVAKCAISPAISLVDMTCTLDCAQSSTSSLRYDGSMTVDRLNSCYRQCERT